MARPTNRELKNARTAKDKRQLRLVSDAPPTPPPPPPELPKPRTKGQSVVLGELTSPSRKPHLIIQGPAGTGKTFLPIRYALHSGMNLVISRPAVSTDEKHGFMPGDANEKMEPWLLPIIDTINEATADPNLFEKMLKARKLVIAPLAYVRGRTFKNAMMILDEAQNATPAQVKLWMTRIGEGSINVMSGDTDQFDGGIGRSGLARAVELFKGDEDGPVKVVTLTKRDIQRHSSIGHILGKTW